MRLLLAFLLFFSSLSASGAQRFAFAGLAWGDSVLTVDAKLRAAGHTGLAPDPKWDVGPQSDVHTQVFSGEIASHKFRGLATFVHEKLTGVHLFWSVNRIDGTLHDIEELLETRYGKGRLLGPPNYDRVWSSTAGESLVLSWSKGSAVEDDMLSAAYSSPEANRRASKGVSEATTQRRVEQKAAEAASRAKAAGL